MNGLNAFARQYRTTGALAMIAQSVADILSHHVKLSVEGIDRMYLNVYVPKLQHEQGIVWFFRNRGKTRGGMNIRFTGRGESDSFWGCHRPMILTACHTPS